MLLILLAIEVATVVLGVRSHLAAHITVGLLLVPPVLLKLASVTWRMLSYYRGASAYHLRGTPPLWLRRLSTGAWWKTLFSHWPLAAVRLASNVVAVVWKRFGSR